MARKPTLADELSDTIFNLQLINNELKTENADLELRVKNLGDTINSLYKAERELRVQLLDRERSLDRAMAKHDELRRDLDRCLGWIDAKQGTPPKLQEQELPF